MLWGCISICMLQAYHVFFFFAIFFFLFFCFLLFCESKDLENRFPRYTSLFRLWVSQNLWPCAGLPFAEVLLVLVGEFSISVFGNSAWDKTTLPTFSSTFVGSYLSIYLSIYPKSFFIYLRKYKLADRSRERPEGSLFNSYNTKL